MIAAWLAGFAVYQWLAPEAAGWWTDFLHHDTPPSGIGASLPSFAAAFALAALAGVGPPAAARLWPRARSHTIARAQRPRRAARSGERSSD